MNSLIRSRIWNGWRFRICFNWTGTTLFVTIFLTLYSSSVVTKYLFIFENSIIIKKTSKYIVEQVEIYFNHSKVFTLFKALVPDICKLPIYEYKWIQFKIYISNNELNIRTNNIQIKKKKYRLKSAFFLLFCYNWPWILRVLNSKSF